MVDGVPLPDPRNARSLLAGSWTGMWLAEQSAVVHGRVLDLGCGNRPFEPWYGPLADFVIALDPAPGSAHNVLAMADNLPLADNSIDTVICTQALEHVDRAEEAMAEVRRVLRPGGHLVLTVPFLYPTHEAPYDFHRWTYLGLTEMMRRHGLELVDLSSQGGPVTLIASWLFRFLRSGVDGAGRAVGVRRPLSLIAPFRWFVLGPQWAIVRWRGRKGFRLNRWSRFASNGYLVLARKPAG